VQLTDGRIGRLTVTYRGEMNNHSVRPLTTALLKGVLERALSTPVNYVNAAVLAAERGLEVNVVKASELEDFANLITVEAQKGDVTTSVAGTLFSRSTPRVVRMNGYHVDAEPRGHFLVTRHLDRPGVIAHVTAILAENGVNIADMTCGRDTPGGTATMAINIDNPVSDEVLRSIEASPLILRAQVVSL